MNVPPASKAPSILAVDDDPNALRALESSLASQGYKVTTSSGGEAALRELDNGAADLIIVGLAVINTSGLEICRRIRQISRVPLIVLSAGWSEEDKVAALDLGADDYLTKPFGMDEFLARVRALLRRVPSAEGDDAVLEAGNFKLDVELRRITVSGNEIKLTPKEFEILKYLFINKRKVVTHRELLVAVWGPESSEETAYLRVFINRLRHKIEPDPTHPRYILTEPWIGYRMDPND